MSTRTPDVTQIEHSFGHQQRQVHHAMLTNPCTFPNTTDIGRLRKWFADDHVHAALIVDGSRLITVIERDDLTGRRADHPARTAGTTTGRVIAPDADLTNTWINMRSAGQRRLAVVQNSLLIGLLCLKRNGLGFCSADDVSQRGRGAPASPTPRRISRNPSPKDE